MATKEFLQARIDKANEFISKKESTIAKKEKLIQKKAKNLQDTYGVDYQNFDKFDEEARNTLGHGRDGGLDIYWTMCDIDSLEDDIRRSQRDINDKKAALTKYEKDLAITIEKDNSRNVQVILDFLNNWKQNTYDWYVSMIPKYEKEHKDYLAENRKLTDEYNNAFANNSYEEAQQIRKDNIKKSNELRKYFYDTWRFILPYVGDDGLEKLEKDLTLEVNRKYDDIIERTNQYVGEITDASNLKIGNKGDLNGYIIGTKGKAKVETIGAGGYNQDVIVNVKHGQIFHFRTIITPVK